MDKTFEDVLIDRINQLIGLGDNEDSILKKLSVDMDAHLAEIAARDPNGDLKAMRHNLANAFRDKCPNTALFQHVGRLISDGKPPISLDLPADINPHAGSFG